MHENCYFIFKPSVEVFEIHLIDHDSFFRSFKTEDISENSWILKSLVDFSD